MLASQTVALEACGTAKSRQTRHVFLNEESTLGAAMLARSEADRETRL
jgi:hypothetical protein